ncbi:uncharacterized protein LOC129905928 [Episyrphus balteatus]|uniref:uncharacterized protein LOC129905928 n=1 Tax=Episyrphus balteatus TaxID=286459 RepID=UPI0024861B82|nr:uncharacterized protein LOC129905928 [Episyrphus balteatus]
MSKCREYDENDSSVMYCGNVAVKESESDASTSSKLLSSETSGIMMMTENGEEKGNNSTALSTQAIVPISSSLPSKLLRLQMHQRQQPVQQNVIAVSQNGMQVYTISNELQQQHHDDQQQQQLPSLKPKHDRQHHNLLIDLGNSGDSMESVSEEEDELKPLPKEQQQQQSPVLNEITNDRFHHHGLHHHHAMPHHYLQYHLRDDQTSASSMNRRGSFEGIKTESMQAKDYHQHHQNGNTNGNTNGSGLDNELGENQVIEIDMLDASEIPDDHLSEEIVEQVEFYFSNDSILKDAFLLKHVRRNKEGFVSLKLVSSFKRVRQLTKDWRVVGHAVRRKGKHIELNEECTKVRRIDPLPSFDETMPSRTIVACDLPMDKLSIEKVSDIFSKCGEIALIRILKPGMAIPVDVRQFMNKYPEMQQKECALVEYIESSAARNAKNLPGNFQVFDMVAPKKKTGKKAVGGGGSGGAPVVKMVENYKNYNYENNFERARGGSFSLNVLPNETDLRFRLRRNHSDFHVKGDSLHHHTHAHSHHQTAQPQHQLAQQQQYAHHALSHYQSLSRNNSLENGNSTAAPNNMNFYASSPRRFNNTAANGEIVAPVRRYSACSNDGYSTCSEISRRPSNCSMEGTDLRRDSGCSENCPCSNSRRGSQNVEPYRKLSHGSDSDCSQRRFSNGSFPFERTYSNASNEMVVMPRRQSNDYNNFSRKPSADSQTGMLIENEHTYRRFSNNFDPKCKMAGYEYYNGRRISTDSGYDRRCSFGSDFEGSPRSRTGSFLNNYKTGEFEGTPRSRTGSFLNATHKAENVVRTPIGPDGSKGFGSRARKFGQTVAPVN